MLQKNMVFEVPNSSFMSSKESVFSFPSTKSLYRANVSYEARPRIKIRNKKLIWSMKWFGNK
jgi:hypothetical protein